MGGKQVMNYGEKKFNKVVRGVHEDLEEQADELLAEHRRKYISAYEDMRDILFPYQLNTRRRREVYVKTGVPSPHLFSGIFSRAHSPDRKRRPTIQDYEDGA